MRSKPSLKALDHKTIALASSFILHLIVIVIVASV